jgi:multicomponent Na+:H+ antiporter subunit A
MFAILALGFVSAALAPTLAPRLGRRAGPVFALVPAAILVWLGFQASTVLGGGAVVAQLAWVPELGVSLDLRLDGLSFVFATLVSAVGLLVTVYAQGYLGQHPELGRFFLYLHAFMGAMLGLVLADDLVALFVFWELTSVTSYLLVGFQAKSEAARRAALKALLITGGGGLALLAGLLIVSQIAGDRSLSAILAATDLDAHALYPAAVLLIAAGAFTKSAQVPFHIWLPGAMAAPAPVSAYLHSATMVKAGVYLLARLNPALGGTPLWSNLLVVVGGATLLTAGVLAIGQRDLKRLLAYSTVSALGTMVLLIGVGTPVAIRAMVVVLLSHALYKGALFMLAGVVDKQTGTRDVTRLAGLRHSMPKTAAAAFLAALSMAGLPPLLGFVGKELFYEATLYGGTAALTLTLVAVLGNSLTVAVAGIVGVRPFLGPRAAATEGGTAAATDPKASLWVPPLILAVLGLLAEVIPGFGSGVLVRPASTAILGVPDTANIYLWHGFTPMLALSVITVALGVAVAWRAPRWRSASDKLGAVAALGPDRVYERGLRGLVRLALRKTRAM